MNRFKAMTQKQKLGLGTIVVAALLCFYTLWPQVAPFPPIAGIYLSKNETELSWISITEKTKGEIVCQWNRMQVSDKGVIKENLLDFTGTVSGKDIEMSAPLPGSTPKEPREIVGTGLRENTTDIRLSLSAADKVMYTGAYELSDRLAMTAAVADFRQRGSALAEAWNQKIKLRETGGRTEADQAIVRRKLVTDGNGYIQKMAEFIVGNNDAIKTYKSNTLSMKDYLANVHKIAGADFAGTRGQLLYMMKAILASTSSRHETQTAFLIEYRKTIIPFFDTLTSQTQLCASTKSRGVDTPAEHQVCEIADKLQTGLIQYSTQMQKSLAELLSNYKAEYALQYNMVEEAKKVR